MPVKHGPSGMAGEVADRDCLEPACQEKADRGALMCRDHAHLDPKRKQRTEDSLNSGGERRTTDG